MESGRVKERRGASTRARDLSAEAMRVATVPRCWEAKKSDISHLASCFYCPSLGLLGRYREKRLPGYDRVWIFIYGAVRRVIKQGNDMIQLFFFFVGGGIGTGV